MALWTPPFAPRLAPPWALRLGPAAPEQRWPLGRAQTDLGRPEWRLALLAVGALVGAAASSQVLLLLLVLRLLLVLLGAATARLERAAAAAKGSIPEKMRYETKPRATNNFEKAAFIASILLLSNDPVRSIIYERMTIVDELKSLREFINWPLLCIFKIKRTINWNF